MAAILHQMQPKALRNIPDDSPLPTLCKETFFSGTPLSDPPSEGPKRKGRSSQLTQECAATAAKKPSRVPCLTSRAKQKQRHSQLRRERGRAQGGRKDGAHAPHCVHLQRDWATDPAHQRTRRNRRGRVPSEHKSRVGAAGAKNVILRRLHGRNLKKEGKKEVETGSILDL